METLPSLLVTGARGLVGRQAVESLRGRYRIHALDRHSQAEAGLADHPHLRWHQVDVGDREGLAAALRAVRDDGGADFVLHLAAHYDFTGEDHPEYWRTNVYGLRNVLEGCRTLRPRRFLFASSVAACAFPPPGAVLDELSPPDGDSIYSQTKRIGEAMVREYADVFPSATVRLAAMFSDWCEYAPLFVFLDTWLSRRWNATVLGGRGESAVPYLHVRELLVFLERLIACSERLPRTATVLASPDGAITHHQIFDVATRYWFGHERTPLHVPRAAVRPGIWVRERFAGLFGERPFERPWMADYVDLALKVDARRTRALLGWEPRPRLQLLRRIPFMLENLRAEPVEFYRRNRALLLAARVSPALRVVALLEDHAEEIWRTFTSELNGDAARLPHYARLTDADHRWHHRRLLRCLLDSVRASERSVFMNYCRDLAEHRRSQGFTVDEVVSALRRFLRTCEDALARDPNAAELSVELRNLVTVTVEFGIDALEDAWDELDRDGAAPPRAPEPAAIAA